MGTATLTGNAGLALASLAANLTLTQGWDGVGVRIERYARFQASSGSE